MAKKGLRAWVKENWVDIANKRSDGSYPKCGRSGGETRKKYPKCVPMAKAKAMSKGQKKSAVARKQKASNRRKSYCARSLGQLKRSSAKTRNDPNSRIRQARRRWKC